MPNSGTRQSSVVYVNAAGEAWVKDYTDLPSAEYVKFKRDVDAFLERLSGMEFDRDQETSKGASLNRGKVNSESGQSWAELFVRVAIGALAVVGIPASMFLFFCSGWWSWLGLPLFFLCGIIGGIVFDDEDLDTQKYDGAAAGFTAYYHCDGGGGCG